MYFVMGCVVTLVGLLGLIFRRPLAVFALKLFSVNGLESAEPDSSRIERIYVLGGSFMILAGIATIAYGLVTET